MEKVTCLAPKSISDLCAILHNQENISIAGGCTDLTLELRYGALRKKRPRALVVISQLPDTQELAVKENGITIGASLTMAELAQSPILTGPYAALSHAVMTIGSPQIRAAATIGGNIANAAACADTLPPLFVLEAEALIASAQGTQWRPVSSIVQGQTKLKQNQAIIAIHLPKKEANWKSAFHKIGSRKTVTIARLSLAISALIKQNTIEKIAVYTGSIAPSPIAVQTAATALQGKVLGENTSSILGEILEQYIRETIPTRASMPYKAYIAKAIAADTLAKIR